MGKKKPGLSPVYGTVAKNVQALLDRDFPGRRGQANRFHKKHPGVPLSKIQRASKDGKLNLDSLEQLAVIFKLAGVYQLLVPGLNAKEPQIAIDRKYYLAARNIARELAEAPE